MKVVNRRTFIAAKGHFEEAAALLHQGAQGSPFPTRVYRSQYGPFDMVALEVEFDNLAQMDAAWREWEAAPAMQELLAKWFTVTVPGGANEVWLLEP